MMICCGMTGKRVGMLGLNMRKEEALTLKMETVTLIKLIVKYIFLADVSFLEVVLERVILCSSKCGTFGKVMAQK
jgi:hypothetical protein